MNKFEKYEYREIGFQITWGIAKAFSQFILLLLLIILIINIFGFGIDNTDYSGFKRSGMGLHVDAQTGLQYLSKDGALIPRLDKNGNHMIIIKE